MSKVVEQIFKLRKDFILIGLTGRTGSGCTTVANMLAKENVHDILTNYTDFESINISNNVRKDRIIHNFITSEGIWKPFTVISASDVIFLYALSLSDFKKFSDSFVSNCTIKSGEEELIKRRLDDVKGDYEEICTKAKSINDELEKGNDGVNKSEIIDFFKEIKKFRHNLNENLLGTKKEVFIDVLQAWGNLIRRYNTICPNNVEVENDSNTKSPAWLAWKINLIIKVFRKSDKEEKEPTPTRIVIDALRNPYEVLYFRERYSAFYLMSINTDDKIRKQKLTEKNYRKDEIDAIDKEENINGNFTASIDIDKCIELSDIFITHDENAAEHNRLLGNQLLTFISLMLHPGLVPPSSIERVMQIAFTAKLNSGCLSRQVGAAVTNESYSVMSIGWNTTAEGQAPCILRSIIDLGRNNDKEAYSDFEKSDDFLNRTKKLREEYKNKDNDKELCGLNPSYCFKDLYTNSFKKQLYNQVHTRSLHAEENAFLQLAKYGTVGVKGGKLFTTASCCELCAKKAYQLGIKEIYYIDSYPGISKKHILGCGLQENRPQMILFHGVIGRAYISLYNPFMSYKDELEEITDIKVKSTCREQNFDELFKDDKWMLKKIDDLKGSSVKDKTNQGLENNESSNQGTMNEKPMDQGTVNDETHTQCSDRDDTGNVNAVSSNEAKNNETLNQETEK